MPTLLIADGFELSSLHELSSREKLAEPVFEPAAAD